MKVRFQKGNKLAKGGKRVGAGRKSDEHKRIEKAVEELAKDFIEKHTRPVLDAYLKSAGGHFETLYAGLGKKYRQWVVDPATTRHWIDKVTPSAKQRIEVSGVLKAEIDRDELRNLSKNPIAEKLAAQFVELMLKQKNESSSKD